MHYLTRSFLPRVYQIKINGPITNSLAQTITKGLQAWPYYPLALMITINSTGGSIVHAKNIADLLKVYSNRYNTPVITFAEDACLGSANIILTAGVKCYSSPYSMIGDLGQVWSQLWFDKLAKKYEVKQEYISVSPNQVKLDPLEPLSKESQTWIKNYAYSVQHDLKLTILKNRGSALQKKGLGKQQIESQVLNTGVQNPQNLVRCGFLDGLRTIDQQMKQRFPHAKIREIKHKEHYLGQ